jgi:acyl-CoA synthetase (AMP-forming)/AMP-acid ligase II/thioesterase domain-containing protein/acyl carrier protein
MLTGPSILELLADHQQQVPDEMAFAFHPSGQPQESTTYGELLARAMDIGASVSFQAQSAPRVVLLYAPGLEFIRALLGCFQAGVVPVPAYPPLSRRMAHRFHVIVQDAGAEMLLTTRGLHQMVTGLSDEAADLDRLPVIFTDELPSSSAAWTPPSISEDQPAFIQYTSGSTADPKGVLVTHGILASNCKAIREKMMRPDDTAVVSWLPMYHDMGLIGAILQPLASRVPVHLMSPLDFLQDPLSWLRLISETGATSSGGPNFAFDLCVRRFDEERLAGVDLSSWSIAWIGAERVRHDTLERFHAAYSQFGFAREAFYPCYGLAETTLFATGGRRGSPPDVLHVRKDALRSNVVIPAAPGSDDTATVVSCGQPAPSHSVLVQGRDNRSVADEDIIGEVLFSGPSLGASYWRRSRSEPLDLDTSVVEGQSYFHTGDLGFIHDGSLYLTGRLKDLIIVRGQNFYPEDVEAIAQDSHRGLRPGCGAAFAVEGLTSEIAILVQEVASPESEFAPAAVAEKVRQAVGAALGLHLHAIIFIQPRTIPKTSSGKVRRAECRRLYTEHGLDVSWSDLVPEPGTDAETAYERVESSTAASTSRPHQEAIREVWERVLRVGRVDDQDDFFELGGTSLNAARMLSLLETELGIMIPFSALMGNSALTSFAYQVELVEAGAHVSCVSFNADGTSRPLHGMLSWPGMFNLYRRLAGLLGEEQPIHAILALDESNGRLPLLSINEMARQAEAETLRLQPEGAYVLCGYSIGGLIAYETARNLTAIGKTVDRLILLDPALLRPRRPFEVLSRATSRSPRQVTGAIVNGLRTTLSLRRLNRGAAASANESSLVAATSRNWDLVNLRAWHRYRPGRWDGPVTILRAAAAARSANAVQAWRSILTSPPEVIDIPAEHISILDEPHMEELGRAIGRVLETAR